MVASGYILHVLRIRNPSLIFIQNSYTWLLVYVIYYVVIIIILKLVTFMIILCIFIHSQKFKTNHVSRMSNVSCEKVPYKGYKSYSRCKFVECIIGRKSSLKTVFQNVKNVVFIILYMNKNIHTSMHIYYIYEYIYIYIYTIYIYIYIYIYIICVICNIYNI